MPVYGVCHDGNMDGDSSFQARDYLEFPACGDIGSDKELLAHFREKWFELNLINYGVDPKEFKSMSVEEQEDWGVADLKKAAKKIKGVWIVDVKTQNLMDAVIEAIDPGNDSAAYAGDRALKAIAQYSAIRIIGKKAK